MTGRHPGDQQRTHRARNIGAESLSERSERETMFRLRSEHLHRRDGAHQAIEGRGVRADRLRDLLGRLRSKRELVGDAEICGYGGCLGGPHSCNETKDSGGRRNRIRVVHELLCVSSGDDRYLSFGSHYCFPRWVPKDKVEITAYVSVSG
jgi:hypothetical protein